MVIIDFLIDAALIFTGLIVASSVIGHQKKVVTFAVAAFVYSIIGFVVAPHIPMVGFLLPFVGMYMVIIGTDFEFHPKVFAVCAAAFGTNLFMWDLVGPLLYS